MENIYLDGKEVKEVHYILREGKYDVTRLTGCGGRHWEYVLYLKDRTIPVKRIHFGCNSAHFISMDDKND